MAHILIIDDDESFRASTSDLLEAVGYAVATAKDGDDGIRQFTQTPFDLVICDLFMPTKDGLETINDILRIAPATPIISITGYDLKSSADAPELESSFLGAAQAFGAAHTLMKPFDPDEFLGIVRRCLEVMAKP